MEPNPSNVTSNIVPESAEQVETHFEQTEFSSSANRILARVIREGLWTNIDNEGSYISEPEQRIKNKQRFLEIIDEEFAKKRLTPGVEGVILPDTEVLTLKARELLKQGVRGLVEDGVILQDEADLAAKLVRLEDIQIVDSGDAAITYQPTDNFPTEDQERNPTYVPKQLITSEVNAIKTIANNLGVVISEDELINVALQTIVVHEWAHSLEKALGIVFYQKLIKSSKYDDKTDFWTAYRLHKRVVWTQIGNIAEPVLPDNKPEIEAFSHKERFATGFETIILLNSLVEAGLTPEQANVVTNGILKSKTTLLKEFSVIRHATGLEDNKLAMMCTDINYLAQQDRHIQVVPELWTDLGYYAPYTPEQLRAMLNGTKELLNNTLAIEDLLQHEKTNSGI